MWQVTENEVRDALENNGFVYEAAGDYFRHLDYHGTVEIQVARRYVTGVTIRRGGGGGGDGFDQTVDLSGLSLGLHETEDQVPSIFVDFVIGYLSGSID